METEAALLTPFREGGIGVIRLRGLGTCALLTGIFQRPSGNTEILPGRLCYGKICSEEGVIDEVVLLVTPEGTGAEINCHGGVLATRRILALLEQKGVRILRPGEFAVKDAAEEFESMPQREAYLLLSKALTRKGISFLHTHLKGALTQWVGRLLREVEGAFELLDEGNRKEAELLLENTLGEGLSALREAHQGIALFHPLRVVIVGKPNVGKSSLFNTLLARERVLVTPYPGTTRDAVEELISLGGYPILLTDSAGIRKTAHPVERLGVREAWRRAGESALILFLLDGSRPLDQEDAFLLQVLKRKRVLPVVNKADLPPVLELGDSFPWPPSSVLRISIERKRGLDLLENALLEALGLPSVSKKPSLIFTPRQRDLLTGFVERIKETMARLARGEEEAGESGAGVKGFLQEIVAGKPE